LAASSGAKSNGAVMAFPSVCSLPPLLGQERPLRNSFGFFRPWRGTI
jgi:hypothetical protein